MEVGITTRLDGSWRMQERPGSNSDGENKRRHPPRKSAEDEDLLDTISAEDEDAKHQLDDVA
jgi:hypothetical protein